MALDAVEEIARALLDHQMWAAASEYAADGSPTGRIMTSTALVHQAAGMVMVQLDVTIDEAMAVLRATAFAEATSLGVLASAVVERRRRLGKGSVHE